MVDYSLYPKKGVLDKRYLKLNELYNILYYYNYITVKLNDRIIISMGTVSLLDARTMKR